MHSRIATIVTLLMSALAPLAAQQGVVGGIAVDLASGRPLPCISVELIDSVGHPFASTRTRFAGDFEFLAPPQGDYRFRFSGLGLASVETVPEALTPSSEFERSFRIALTLLDTIARKEQLALRDSMEIPRFIPGKGSPLYPMRRREKRTHGVVIIGYAVTDRGRVHVGSAIPLHASHPDFMRAVERSLPDLRFHPARIADAPACMFRTGSYLFSLDGVVGYIEIG